MLESLYAAIHNPSEPVIAMLALLIGLGVMIYRRVE